MAYKRHFPAINWLNSYSLYDSNVAEFFEKEGGTGFNDLRKKAMEILQKEAALEEIVRLVGVDSLSLKDQFLLEVSRMIREDFLHQNAFIDVDSYTSLKKQYNMIKSIMEVFDNGNKEIDEGKKINEILTREVREKIAKMKLIEEK